MKWLVYGAVVCLIVGSVGGAQAQKAKRQAIVKKKAVLASNLNGLRGKMAKLGSQIRVKRAASQKLEGDIEWADNEQSKIADKLDLTRERLAEGKHQQVLIARQLEAETRKLASVKKQVGSRLKNMYMSGNETLLSVMIGSKSIGDFAGRKLLVERIATRDQELFAEAARVRDQVILKKREKDRALAKVVTLTYVLKNDLAAMAVIKKRKHNLLVQAEKEQSVLEDEYDGLADESKQIEREIQAYQARLGDGMGKAIFSGRFHYPVNGRITSGYGSRYHPILHRTRMHTGIDFGASTGTPIHAAGSGIVIFAGRKGGYGNCVVIDHGGGISTLYGHCSRIFVSSGQRVSTGQKIAAVGATGLATGPHLHFEVRVHGTPVNPMGRL